MIQLKIKVQIHPNKLTEFEQAVTHLLNSEKTACEKCRYDLTKSLDDDLLYIYTEEWDNKEQLNRHIEADGFHALLGAMKVLGDIIDSKIIYSSSEQELIL